MSYPLIGQLSTTREDMATFSNPTYTLPFRNTNHLVYRDNWNIQLTKTGFTNAAGHCLIMRTVINQRPVALVVIMGGIVLCSLWVPNAQPSNQGRKPHEGGFFKQLRSPGVLAFYACVALMQMSHGPYYTFLTLHLEHLGYSRGVIGMLWPSGWWRKC